MADEFHKSDFILFSFGKNKGEIPPLNFTVNYIKKKLCKLIIIFKFQI